MCNGRESLKGEGILHSASSDSGTKSAHFCGNEQESGQGIGHDENVNTSLASPLLLPLHESKDQHDEEK
ncbi:hypothetical protein M8J77_024302 [Diaphorina citri]|nr:hypothetical protein M8J77_024302 [Diaphorina citri]